MASSAPSPTRERRRSRPANNTWRGIFHEDIGLKLRGWVANGSGTPWKSKDGKGGWGGDSGCTERGRGGRPAGLPRLVFGDGGQRRARL